MMTYCIELKLKVTINMSKWNKNSDLLAIQNGVCQWNLIHSFTTLAHIGKRLVYCEHPSPKHLWCWMIASQINDHALVMVPLWWVPFVTFSNVRITVMLSEFLNICTQYSGCSEPWTAMCHSKGFRDTKRASCETGSPHCLNTEITQNEQSFFLYKSVQLFL
jgi:hypothetical protein